MALIATPSPWRFAAALRDGACRGGGTHRNKPSQRFITDSTGKPPPRQRSATRLRRPGVMHFAEMMDRVS